MLRLYVDADLAAGLGDLLELPPGPARHVQVRRLQPGDEVLLFDGRGGEWSACVRAMTRQRVQVQVLAHRAVERELPWPVTLAVGMPANERMDWLVEKATELGAATIQPLLCERAVLRLEGERAERKRAHWRALAEAAAEQCGRTRVPCVQPVRRLADYLDAPAPPALRWLLSPQAATGPARPPTSQPIVLLSGPEGGLGPAEEAAACAAGFVGIALGARILRAETAPLAVLAWLSLTG
jgi:16S rRNA (uracil1498-N3)-methyltransferase